MKIIKLIHSALIFLSLAIPIFAKNGEGFNEKEVKVDVSSSVQLAGTLTLPSGKAPLPAILLITSAGGQNRDQMVDGVPMFKIIAHHLSKNGFAVLRMDKRGVGNSTGGSTWTSNTAEKAVDMEACVKFLKTLPEINSKKIGLVGHSEASGRSCADKSGELK